MLKSLRVVGLLATLGAVAVVAGCGGKGGAPVGAPTAPEEEPDLGIPELRKSLESTVLENYEQLTLGNIGAFADGLATQREVQLLGVTPSDVRVGTSPKGEREDRRLFREPVRDLRILSKNLHLHLSADGSVGWVYDEASYRVAIEGRVASVPIRTTQMYVRDVDRWVLAAEHLSYGIPIVDILQMARAGELADMPSIGTSMGAKAEVAAPLLGLVGGFINSGDADDLALQGHRTLVLLPAADLEFHGEGAPSLSAIFGGDSTVALREFRIQFARNRKIAWMLASLRLNSSQGGAATQVPLRGSFVFERGDRNRWHIVQVHISVSLTQSQVNHYVFGRTAP